MSAHFAVCARGLETALGAELTSLGATDVVPAHGGVAFDADLRCVYAIHLQTRLASRVLRQVGQARYRDDDDLYKLAARTPWEDWFDVSQTLRVDVNAQRAAVRSLNFATLRIKDGIVDRFRRIDGERPSIDTRRPDVRVFGFLDERQLTLYLDLSGEPLFKRGWRDDGASRQEAAASGDRADAGAKGEAPLKETLAAGLLALSGWRPDMPLYDPFCGSGTILVEAAQIAAGIAPGHARTFGFEALRDLDAGLWAREREQARSAGTTPASPLRLAGSDIDATALDRTRRNLARAGLPPAVVAGVSLSRADFALAPPPFDEPGLLLCNPPYGERLALEHDDAPGYRGADPRGARHRESGHRGARREPVAGRGSGRDDAPSIDMQRFAEPLKRLYRGWTVCMLTTDLSLPRQLGLKERRKTPLFNGPLECRLFRFEIFDR